MKKERKATLDPLAKRIASYLAKHGLSQEEFCERTGLDAALVSDILNARRSVTPKYRERLLDFFETEEKKGTLFVSTRGTYATFIARRKGNITYAAPRAYVRTMPAETFYELFPDSKGRD